MQAADLPSPLDELYAYRASKLRGRRMPSRADIDPAEIKHLLPIVLLTDVIGDEAEPRFRYRLAGTEIVRRFGRELTGHGVEEMLKGDYGRSVVAVYKAVVQERVPIYSRTRVAVHSGEKVGSDRLMLPLSADGERVNMVFTGQIFDHNLSGPELTMWLAHNAEGASSTTTSDAIPPAR
jgi:hypothetical protein